MKGLYEKAWRSEASDFNGIDSLYQAPQSPEVMIDTQNKTIEECVHTIL